MACKSKKAKAVMSVRKSVKSKKDGKGGPLEDMLGGKGAAPSMGADPMAGLPAAPAKDPKVGKLFGELKSVMDSLPPDEKDRIGSMTVSEAIGKYSESPAAPAAAPAAAPGPMLG
jgi:hypothetical protein